MMDAFASVISNNLNIVMKILAIITIIMAIPTMIFSAYGMNVNSAGMPFAQSPSGFLIIIVVAVTASVLVGIIFSKLKTVQ
jgi:magnesium transporter